ncbi:GNAT family N-acetyltransferase [Legionella spiritensis]|uniref:Putative Acetyltransferase, GNAT family n=1 Tax=Legionella spiritensis TaxID=452 RepID=A0A0W0Z4M4_LEGSP|nr:GNAT family N-acetyltransferase [Legionella spiritensis]KTD64092.1 putative Acetyltransferase, GNAT family [Legionella spiritensis]SNV37747.1 putative Acetyltransferase, GNAT family [Legionella spiritensis]
MLVNFNDICFNNLKSYWIALASIDESAVIETSDSVRICTGMNNPLFNPIFLTKDAHKLPSVYSHSSYSFWYDSKRNKNIPLQDLQELEPIMQHVPMMSIQLNKEFKQDSVPDIKISVVDNGNDLSHWIAPVKVAFEMDDRMALRYQRCLEQAHRQFTHFTAKKNGLVVAAASLFLHDEIAGLYNLAVLPEFRRQGIATALHYARLNEAKSRGYKHATLQATPMASALDNALGFETHSELSIYKF